MQWRTPWLKQRLLLLSLALLDALLLVGSYNLLFWIHFGRWAGITGSITALAGLWLSVSYLLGRYSQPNSSLSDTRRQRLAATLLVGGLMLIVVLVFSWGLKLNDPRTFRGFVVPVLGTATAISAATQIWLTTIERRPRHWLLVGSAQELAVLRQELSTYPSNSCLQISFCESDSLNLMPCLNEGQVDGMAISEMCSLPDRVVEELMAMRGRGAAVCSLVSWSEIHLQRVPPELFTCRWLVQAEGFQLQPGRWGWRVKRLGDLVVATTLLLFSLPVMAAAVLAIRLEDGGPVLYGQIRTGLYGEPYRIWKLRSMHQNSEPNGAQWAGGPKDSRVTRVGQWIRQLRIDELPQLLAVLKGEMSLIGPRPERPEIETHLEAQIPHYRVRHWIRPGLSGWAQVCFPYGASVDDSRMKLSYDLYYLRNASLLLDLLILMKTIRLISRGQGSKPNHNAI